MKYKLTLPGLYLVIVNLIPIIGVALFDWSSFHILIAYWAENIVIGLSTILKFATVRPVGGLTSQPPLPSVIIRLYLGIFFTLHFGLFTAVHGLFVFGVMNMVGGAPDFQSAIPVVGSMVVFFLVSHGASFWFNYIQQGEYRRLDPVQILISPYGRVVVMHLTLLIGVFLVAVSTALSGSALASCLIVMLKTGLDYFFHQRQHRHSETT